MTLNRLIREATLLKDTGLGSVAVTPAPALAGPVALTDLRVPVGTIWDLAAVDVLLSLALSASLTASSAVTAFLYAGSVPIGSVDLQPAGPASFGGLVAPQVMFWRAILNLPSPISITDTDKPFTLSVSAVAASSIAAGTNIQIGILAADSKLTFYGGTQ